MMIRKCAQNVAQFGAQVTGHAGSEVLDTVVEMIDFDVPQNVFLVLGILDMLSVIEWTHRVFERSALEGIQPAPL